MRSKTALYSDMEEKQKLRRMYLAQRAALSEDTRADISAHICDALLQSAWYKSADTVLCYAASGSEISVDAIAKAALKDGKTVCFPRCLDKNGSMRFYTVHALSDLTVGMYGIKEPGEHTALAEHFSSDALCLMPGLAFDANGYRLGYGKGYYDRFLQGFAGKKIGICPQCGYSEIQLWEYDRYDIAADAVLTETAEHVIQST